MGKKMTPLAELKEECEKRGLPVSAIALARHERNSGLFIGATNAMTKFSGEKKSLVGMLRQVKWTLQENQHYDEDAGERTDPCRYCQNQVLAHAPSCILVLVETELAKY